MTSHPRRWAMLGALAVALLTMSVSVMAVTIAVPAIGRELSAGTSELQWITKSTVLALASLLLAMGVLANRVGRRRILLAGLAGLAGLAVFAVASALAASAGDVGWLIAARALLGVGNAMIMPPTLSIVRTVFSRAELPRALAVWAGVASLGVVLGPLAGGFLVQQFGWRALFVANVVAALLAAAAVLLVLPAFPGGPGAPVDVVGLALASGGLLAVVHTIIEGPRHGWVALCTGTAGALLLAGFVVRERRATRPMLDRALVGARSCWPAAIAAATGFFALMGVLFLVTQHFQNVRGYPPMHAALLLLPIAAGQLGMAPATPRLIARLGARRTVAIGLPVLTAGLLLATAGLPAGRDWLLLVGLAVLAAGNAITVTAASSSIMATATPAQGGAAAAVNETAFKLGGSLGVAVLGSVVAAFPPDSAGFVRGFGTALPVAAGVALVVGAVVVALHRNPRVEES